MAHTAWETQYDYDPSHLIMWPMCLREMSRYNAMLMTHLYYLRVIEPLTEHALYESEYLL